MAAGYLCDFPTAPAVATQTTAAEGTWDVSDWDAANWASSGTSGLFESEWTGAHVHGDSLAPQFQIVSGQSYLLDCELVRIDVLYTAGSPIG